MNDRNTLDRLGPIADEMLAGLHADQQMKLRIREAVQSGASHRAPVRFKAVYLTACCAWLVVACVGFANALLDRLDNRAPVAAQIHTIAAGDNDNAAPMDGATLIADLSSGARVRSASQGGSSLFATGTGDMPLVATGGAVYRLLTEPATLSRSLRGDALGTVAHSMEDPSLASAQQMKDGLSNVVSQGASIYEIDGIDSKTAVAAEVDGQMRVFQRVSYAGKGPGKQDLEDTFDVRGQIKTLELSGVGTLDGQKADDVIAVLLDHATLKSADASTRKQTLTVTLDSGLKLQLGVSGDTVYGCGGWSCPEFFEAFDAAL